MVSVFRTRSLRPRPPSVESQVQSFYLSQLSKSASSKRRTESRRTVDGMSRSDHTPMATPVPSSASEFRLPSSPEFRLQRRGQRCLAFSLVSSRLSNVHLGPSKTRFASHLVSDPKRVEKYALCFPTNNTSQYALPVLLPNILNPCYWTSKTKSRRGRRRLL